MAPSAFGTRLPENLLRSSLLIVPSSIPLCPTLQTAASSLGAATTAPCTSGTLHPTSQYSQYALALPFPPTPFSAMIPLLSSQHLTPSSASTTYTNQWTRRRTYRRISGGARLAMKCEMVGSKTATVSCCGFFHPTETSYRAVRECP